MLARATLTATALLAFAQNAGAHGNIKETKATFTNGAPIVQWVTMIDNFWDIGTGGDQVGKFKTMAKEKGMGFNDVVLDMVKDKKWGYTRTDVDPNQSPPTEKLNDWPTEEAHANSTLTTRWCSTVTIPRKNFPVASTVRAKCRSCPLTSLRVIVRQLPQVLTRLICCQ
ncbi:hypothetical protein GQ600_25370 [Phytophthora cactorum]|nr:hypothetical protein GQ600_25370 [Phytophthora cactorum]